LLSIPGRTSGLLRTTPVAVVTVGGERYLVAGYETSDWVKNARAAGWGIIGRGKTSERVALTELSPKQGVAVLRAFAHDVRGGRSFLTVKADGSEADFLDAGAHHPVFQLN
jgi:hypothetical protein